MHVLIYFIGSYALNTRNKYIEMVCRKLINSTEKIILFSGFNPQEINRTYDDLARQVEFFSGMHVNPFFPTVPTCAVRETASLGIMGEPRVPPLNPSESIVLSKHYRLRGV